ncbi:hypothetical protein OSB04_014336 [Centaurea solstitialis]|uniref:EXS domain-containing protein n=1 Tax=Centaurea solstitialis TaxID=347529 RepID=A0AA38TAB9_9ASTR|nr:hypothetical protein OSB04_014336 [Centaurea solstitialis]
MFGGHVTVPVNSPHLRKSGSRQLFSDLGGSEEAASHSVESEMKGVGGTPLATAAMLPSPVLLWRLKVMLFFLWGFSCCKIGWDSVMRMSLDLRDLFLYEAFLYYNPFLLVTAAVWFWGANLWVFAQANVNYSKIFDLDQNHLTHKEIWKCATWMTIIVPTSMTSYLYLYSHGEVSWAASQPAIAFADFFVADILTSMSKVFSDLERSVCRMVHKQVATIAWFEADSVCGSHAVAIPIVLVLPYIFRFFQCLRQYKDTKEKTSLLNVSRVPDSWTNFYRPLWLLSSVVNSLYSFYWDVTRDWDLSCFTRIFKFSKPHIVSQIVYGQKWVYLWVIGSNLILRCTWTYKLSAHLRHNHLTVFAITTLEIFRRFQWAFFRVENEWNKTNSKQNLQMGDISVEEEKLLNVNNHNV